MQFVDSYEKATGGTLRSNRFLFARGLLNERVIGLACKSLFPQHRGTAKAINAGASTMTAVNLSFLYPLGIQLILGCNVFLLDSGEELHKRRIRLGASLLLKLFCTA